MAGSQEIGVTSFAANPGKYVPTSGETTVGAGVLGGGRLGGMGGGGLGDQIRSWAKMVVEEKIPAVVKEVGRRICYQIIENSPTDGPYTTGTFISYWRLSEGSPDTESPGNEFRQTKYDFSHPYAALSAKEAEIDAFFSTNRNFKNLNFFFTNSLPYARRVEYTGWGGRGPYRPVGKAMREAQNIVEQVITEMSGGNTFKYGRW